MNEKDAIIKKQILFLLRGGNTHNPVKRTINNYPQQIINGKIPGVEYTPYQLLDHMNRAQNDFLGFIYNPKHQSPDWPEGFWTTKTDADSKDWKKLKDDFFDGLDKMESIIKNKDVDIFSPITHAPQYTIYREAIMLASHNSYHLGQLMLMKKALLNNSE